MRILKTELFSKELDDILGFIARDSAKARDRFKSELTSSLKKLDFMPYKFRQSTSFDDKNIRDFIYKGYVVPYLIDKANNKIFLLAIFKHNIITPQ